MRRLKTGEKPAKKAAAKKTETKKQRQESCRQKSPGEKSGGKKPAAKKSAAKKPAAKNKGQRRLVNFRGFFVFALGLLTKASHFRERHGVYDAGSAGYLYEYLVPMVVEQSNRGETCLRHLLALAERARDFCHRRGEDYMASLVTAQLLFLEADNPKKEISMYINSPGGVVTSGMAIYDTMQYIRAPVATLCIGQAASMGSLLLAAGEKGMRYALPNARIMVHQPSGGFRGRRQTSSVTRRKFWICAHGSTKFM